MPKISFSGSKGLFAKYALKIILSTILSILVLSAVASFIILKLDLDLKAVAYISCIISFLSSGIISYVSITGFKNNYLVLSLISVVPYITYVFVNMLNSKNYTHGIISIALVIFTAVIISILKSTKNR